MADNGCPPEGCVSLKHVLEVVTDHKIIAKELVNGQHRLDNALTSLNSAVLNLNRLNGRVETLEKNQWRMIGSMAVIVPIITSLTLHFIGKGP